MTRQLTAAPGEEDIVLSEAIRLLDPNWMDWLCSTGEPLFPVKHHLSERVWRLVVRIRKNLAVRMTVTVKG